MENRKLIKLLVPIVLLGLFVFGVPSASAYGIETHAYLTSEVINLYNQNYSNNQISGDLKNYLIDGSRKEDEAPRWLNHFYDPVYDRGLDTLAIKGYKSKEWAQDANKQNEAKWRATRFIASVLTAAEQRKISEISADADFTWNKAIQFYAQGDTEKAMFALGHVLHLIEDAGVPDHTRNDDHPTGSPYENFAKRFNLNNPDGSLMSRVSGRGAITLNNLDGYFSSLATYSNNNFYSLDTIGIQSGYNLPQPDYTKKDGRYFYGFKRDEEGNDYRLFVRKSQGMFDTVVSDTGNIVLVVNDSGGDLALYDYWSHLSPKVVQHGAGVINLFFQEAERAKNDPRFAKKEKKNFLTQAIDAAKVALSNIFNKTSNKPVAVVDVNQSRQPDNPAPNRIVVQSSVSQNINSKQSNVSQSNKVAAPKKEIASQQVQSQGGKASEQCRFDTSSPPSHQGVIINEVAWMGGPASAGLGSNDEWIELKNISNKTVDIDGWWLLDEDEKIQVVFDEGAKIRAGGFYLLERSNDDSAPNATADLTYSGALSNSDEGLRLLDANCSLIDEVTADPDWPAGDASERRTMQRDGGLNWYTFSGSAISGIFGTPKKENGPRKVEQPPPAKSKVATKVVSQSALTSGSSGGSGSQTSSQSPKKLLITEIQITGGAGKTDHDFIEIYNPNSTSVNLNGYRLVKRTKTGTSDTSIKSWTSDTSVGANSYYLWANSGHTELGVTPDVTTSATISNDNGVAIRFGGEDTGTIIDSVGWGEAANAFVEGSVFGINPGANQSIHRKTQSPTYSDADNNTNDFEISNCLSPKADPCQSNQAPTAVFSFSPSNPQTGNQITFNAASSTDSDGQIASYNWDFGDSTTASSSDATTTHSYSSAGNYTVSLTVLDNQNASSTTASSTVNVTAPAPSPSVLFEQSDSSGSIQFSGGQFYSFGSGVNGSANKLKIKFNPENVSTNNRYYVAPWRIRENGGLELDFWYAANETFANQPKYCFSTSEANTFKDTVFTFSSSLNFSSSKTYDVYLLYLQDQPERVCNNQENVGTGNQAQGTYKANAANNLVYFQLGSNL